VNTTRTLSKKRERARERERQKGRDANLKLLKVVNLHDTAFTTKSENGIRGVHAQRQNLFCVYIKFGGIDKLSLQLKKKRSDQMGVGEEGGMTGVRK